MSKLEKVRERILNGANSAQNIDFEDLCWLLTKAGFEERVKSSHRIFTKQGVVEIINLQPRPDGKAKPYQVRQVRQLFVEYQIKPT